MQELEAPPCYELVMAQEEEAWVLPSYSEAVTSIHIVAETRSHLGLSTDSYDDRHEKTNSL